MEWFTIGLNSLAIAVEAVLQVNFSCRASQREFCLWPLASSLLLAGVVTAVFRSRYSGLTMAVGLLILYGINRILLNNSRFLSCVVASMAAYIARVALDAGNSLTALILPRLLVRNPSRSLPVICFPVLITLLTILLCCVCLRQLAKHFAAVFWMGVPYRWLFLPVCLLLMIMELFLGGKAAVERCIPVTKYGPLSPMFYNSDWRQPLAVLALQFLGVGALFAALHGCKWAEKESKARTDLAMQLQKTRLQKAYIVQTRKRYERTRSFRHDVRNHLAVLEGLLKKNDMAGAQHYLKKLDAATGELSFPVCTGNPVLDILLGDKLELAREAGISVEASLTAPAVGADDLDLCIIFANALDNAIAACKEAGKDPYIRVTGEQQGDFYMLEFENSCSPHARKEMGTGLSNVKKAVEKYGGTLSIEIKGERFLLGILWQQHGRP